MTARIMWSIHSRVPVNGLARKCQLVSENQLYFIQAVANGDAQRHAHESVTLSIGYDFENSHRLQTYTHTYTRVAVERKSQVRAGCRKSCDRRRRAIAPLCYASVFLCVCVCVCVFPSFPIKWSKRSRCFVCVGVHNVNTLGARSGGRTAPNGSIRNSPSSYLHTHTHWFSTSVCRRRRRRFIL